MGYVVQSKCLACGYESEHLTIGDACHQIATCYSCHSIVNPERRLFRLDIPPCPTCGVSLSRDAFINAGHLRVDYRGRTQTEHKCPRCDGGYLVFQSIMHFSSVMQDHCPQKNAYIHGRYRGNELEVPGLWLSRGETFLENPPEQKNDQPMELFVTGVQRDGGHITQLRLRFVRYLDDANPNGSSSK